MKKSLPPAPRYLSKEAKGWWKKLNSEYFLSDESLLILEGALQCLDRWREAQAILDEHGLTMLDRFGQAKLRPEVVVERDSRAAMGRQLKTLGLDLEPLNAAPGRPSGR